MRAVEFDVLVMALCPHTDCDHESITRCSGWAYAVDALDALKAAGFVILRDEPDHFVTFDESGWFIEHSIACRVAGTLGTCGYNAAIRWIADEPDPRRFGRWRITNIDSDGLPSMERAHRDV